MDLIECFRIIEQRNEYIRSIRSETNESFLISEAITQLRFFSKKDVFPEESGQTKHSMRSNGAFKETFLPTVKIKLHNFY